MDDGLVIHDLHRILGPLMDDQVPTDTVGGLIGDLDELGVTSCSAVLSWQWCGDPSGRDATHAPLPSPLAGWVEGRVHVVPLILPAAPGGGWPADPDQLVAAGVRMVRACPGRHRWSLDSPPAMAWWGTLADAGCAVSLDVSEVGFGGIRALARSFPELTVVALNPGYRELRRTAELLEAAPNVLAEVGTLNTSGGVEWLAAVAGAERLVFGTGGPVNDDAGATWLLRHLDLPRDQVERIAHGNAARLLGVGA